LLGFGLPGFVFFFIVPGDTYRFESARISTNRFVSTGITCINPSPSFPRAKPTPTHAPSMPPKTKRTDEPEPETKMEVEGDAALRMIRTELGHAELRACIASAGCENKNAKLIMMNSTAIPCCAERCRDGEKKYTPVKLTLVHVQSAGFSVAPYSVPFGGGKGKVGENPKPLSVVQGGAAPALRMWPFKKESVPGSRGARLEVGLPCFACFCSCTAAAR